MSEYIYKSRLGEHIRHYIQFRESLGYSEDSYRMLRQFDSMCFEIFPDESTVTENMVKEWTNIRKTENTNGHIRRMITLRGFLNYLRMIGKSTVIIPEGFIRQYNPFLPYI